MPAPSLTRATFLRFFPPALGFGGPMRQAPREQQQPAGASGGGRRAAGRQPPSPAYPCSLRSWALEGNSLPPASLRVCIALHLQVEKQPNSLSWMIASGEALTI